VKLAMITTYATPTNMRRELLVAARKRGHEICVIAPEPNESMSSAVQEIGGRYVQWSVERAGLDPVADLASARRLLATLRAERPDVVLLYQIKAVLLGPALAKLAGTTHVAALVNGLGAVFDVDGFGRTWKGRLARRLYGVSLRFVDRLIFQNADDPQLLRTLGLLARDRAVTIVPGSGVDIQKFEPRVSSVEPFTFTLVSRLIGSKGIREFVEAARRIRARAPTVRFRIAGPLEADGHPDAVRQSELDGWVAEKLIDYVGFTNDIRGLLAATSVFVLPSYYREGIPRTNLEALAAGLPIITTDWVGCRETVIHEHNGFLVPPRDTNVLADCMQRYLDDPSLLARHGRESRALAETRFDVHRVNELMLEALRLR
jgi:glycosyltransferase involved in cell wall biosynthesis